MTKSSKILILVSLVLSHVMVGVVAYSYRDMICGIMHSGYSAPANIAFLLAVPFVVGIAVCLGLAYWVNKKKKG